MKPNIIQLPQIRLVGMKKRIAIQDHAIPSLWQQFMPRKKELMTINPDLYSVQVHDRVLNYSEFGPSTEFIQWAAAPVGLEEPVPDGMAELIIPQGEYAIFTHKGPASTFQTTLNKIYLEWLPESSYVIDHRPHFELLGDRYKGHLNPESEEDLYVPVRKK